MIRHFIKDIKYLVLPTQNDILTIAEKDYLPLNIQRFFIVKSKKNTKRGHHAHRQLTQYLICVHGLCDVICDDGKIRRTFHLTHTNQALLIPPGIWAEQIYHKKDTTLLVACDAEYDEADYFRVFDEFLIFRKMTP